jgi:hypothetical protein
VSAVNPVLVALAAVVVAVLAARAVMAMRPAGPRLPDDRPRASLGLLPRSSAGRWSAGLALAFALALATAQTTPGIDPFARDAGLVLELVGKLVLGGAAAAAFVVGLVAVVKRRDRSLLVYLGMAVTLWVGLVPVIGSLFFE